ncbi:unnamed protein product [Ambrosiozyma monospora]|uniref:Unnamed protein product n=1 Tax=Ambrosiozyma monospora TaxID=43982 RepID=A0A9W7DEU8_AMBMO|nr:unnamed protein product [Ambrosiozyma monospora]
MLNMHFIIKENRHVRNHRFVADAKDDNIASQSMVISNREIATVFKRLFIKLGPNTAIVGHNVLGDIETLIANCGVEFPGDIRILDTEKLWFGLLNVNSIAQCKYGLTYILNKLSIPHAYLHNAINDAYYTMVACLMMCSPSFVLNCGYKENPNKKTEKGGWAKVKPLLKFNPPEEVLQKKLGKAVKTPSNTFYKADVFNYGWFDDMLSDVVSGPGK